MSSLFPKVCGAPTASAEVVYLMTGQATDRTLQIKPVATTGAEPVPRLDPIAAGLTQNNLNSLCPAGKSPRFDLSLEVGPGAVHRIGEPRRFSHQMASQRQVVFFFDLAGVEIEIQVAQGQQDLLSSGLR